VADLVARSSLNRVTKRNIPEEFRLLDYNDVLFDISQKMELLMTIAVTTSNPKEEFLPCGH
jgi:hypothetical protein